MTYQGFKRYTNLAAAIHMLATKSIALLNPATWDDKNDAYFMAEFKRYSGAKSVLALCFAQREETYHHWRVFSDGRDGVCFDFDKRGLLSTFRSDERIRQGLVEYKELSEIRAMKSVPAERLPFLKRYPYQDESEYRVVYVDHRKAEEFVEYELDVSWIERITLSPWMPDALADSVKQTLLGIDGCSSLRVSRSTLVDNESWKELASRARPIGSSPAGVIRKPVRVTASRAKTPSPKSKRS